MPEASKRPVIEKLGIKKGDRIAIIRSPKGYTSVLADLPGDVTLTTRLAGEPFHLVQGFYEDKRTLAADLRKLRKSILPNGKIWICWRKGNATDLSRDSIVELGEKFRLESVASCAIDDEWSALKLMLPKSERT